MSLWEFIALVYLGGAPDSSGPGWSLEVCISNKVSVISLQLLVWGPHLKNPCR